MLIFCKIFVPPTLGGGMELKMVVYTVCLSALILHLTLSLVFCVLVKAELMKISMQFFPLVLFVPLWGILMALNAEWCTRHNLTGSKEIELDRLGLADNDYRMVGLVEDDSEKTVVPLEEAIFVNDAETRRKMMIDILQQDPKQYISLLQKARFDEDIEVTHYASTAIMEVQREYELEIQRCERAVADNPDNVDVIEECADAYKAYIGSKLMADNILSMQRVRYRDILEKRLAFPGADRQIYFDAVDNLLELRDVSAAQRILDSTMRKWPHDERGWILKIKYYHQTNNSSMIEQTISKMEQIYLSPAGRDCISFWSK